MLTRTESESSGGEMAAQVILVAYIAILAAVSTALGLTAWRSVELATAAEGTTDLRLLGVTWSVSAESSIFLVVICFGVIGSIVHMGTSLTSYIGNGRFRTSWSAWYFLRPFIATALAVLSYTVFRAGLFSGQAPAENINLFGVAAVAGLAGLFSKQVIDKLHDVMNVVFASSENADRSDKLEPLTISAIDPSTAAKDHPVRVTITGTGFGNGARVQVGTDERVPATQSGNSMTVHLTTTDVAATGPLTLRVLTASGELSEPATLQIT